MILFVLRTIITTAIVITNAETAAPVAPSIILRETRDIEPSLKVVSMVDSNVSIDTQAAAMLIILLADNMGLLYFRYLIRLMIAMVNVVNVYAAMAIAVIMLCSKVRFQ
ncbi:MAG: hypothetical protein IJO13_11445 [Lachnospiraceae bacterium]|nr:hypothetical protein [Lachnospiraceae bacterium]